MHQYRFYGAFAVTGGRQHCDGLRFGRATQRYFAPVAGECHGHVEQQIVIVVRSAFSVTGNSSQPSRLLDSISHAEETCSSSLRWRERTQGR